MLYTHIGDLSVPMEETLGAFADLQQEGLIRMIAASNLTADRLHLAVATRPGADTGHCSNTSPTWRRNRWLT